MYGSVQRREKLKGGYQSKMQVNEQFGRKMNEDRNGNRKLFWKRGGELQQHKGWKWEVGTGEGRNEKDLE